MPSLCFPRKPCSNDTISPQSNVNYNDTGDKPLCWFWAISVHLGGGERNLCSSKHLKPPHQGMFCEKCWKIIGKWEIRVKCISAHGFISATSYWTGPGSPSLFWFTISACKLVLWHFASFVPGLAIYLANISSLALRWEGWQYLRYVLAVTRLVMAWILTAEA